jgi:hypothetical protein
MAVRADSTTAPIAQQTLPKKNRMLDGKPSCGCTPAILQVAANDLLARLCANAVRRP